MPSTCAGTVPPKKTSEGNVAFADGNYSPGGARMLVIFEDTQGAVRYISHTGEQSEHHLNGTDRSSDYVQSEPHPSMLSWDGVIAASANKH